MMAGVSADLKKKILSDYYANMYEDEDADQEFFDSIRNTNRDDEEGEGEEGDGERKSANRTYYDFQPSPFWFDVIIRESNRNDEGYC